MVLLRVLLLAAASLAGSAHAAMLLSYSVIQDGEESERHLRLTATQAVLWAQMPGKPEWLYDSASDTLTYLDHRDYIYTPLTEEWATNAQQQVRQAMGEMKQKADEQSGEMDPRMRAQYQKGMDMMRMAAPFMSGFLNPPARTSMPSFRNGTVADIPCREVRIMEQSQIVQQLCVAGTGDLKLSSDEQRTLDGLLRLSRVLVQQNAFYFGFTPPPLAAGDSGLALAIKEGKDRWVLTAIGPTNDEDFTIPSSYLEGKIPLPGIP